MSDEHFTSIYLQLRFSNPKWYKEYAMPLKAHRMALAKNKTHFDPNFNFLDDWEWKEVYKNNM